MTPNMSDKVVQVKIDTCALLLLKLGIEVKLGLGFYDNI